MASVKEAADRVFATSLPDKEAVSRADLDALFGDIRCVLRSEAFRAWSHAEQARMVRQIVALYVMSWHETATQVAQDLKPVFAALAASGELPIGDIAELYDGMLFLFWCATNTIAEQAAFGSDVVPPFLSALHSMPCRTQRPRDTARGPLRVAYLGQFCFHGSGNALGEAALQTLTALSEEQGFEVYLFAWMYSAEEFLAAASALGVTVRTTPTLPFEERVQAILAQLDHDRIDVVISDMNSAVPTALFVQRCAPMQLYLQLGLPFWPVPTIDGVLLGWHVAPKRIGFEGYRCFNVSPHWDLAKLRPEPNPEALAAERRLFPPGRVIGLYGRMAKVTIDYLDLAIRLVTQYPDLTFAIGGSGNADVIRAHLRVQGVEHRFLVIDRFVDGHLWGHILDIFLDTWPLHGGYSVREVMAKGKPAVSMVSPDMPNLSREKDAALVCETVAAYEAAVRRLLDDPAWYKACCRNALRIAERKAARKTYGMQLRRSIRSVRTALRIAQVGRRFRGAFGRVFRSSLD